MEKKRIVLAIIVMRNKSKDFSFLFPLSFLPSFRSCLTHQVNNIKGIAVAVKRFLYVVISAKRAYRLV